jgi:hypothetical protein
MAGARQSCQEVGSRLSNNLETVHFSALQQGGIESGFPYAVVYLRQKLVHLDPIRKALEEEWWPEIQMHCKLDLRLGDPKVGDEWAEARKMIRKVDAE